MVAALMTSIGVLARVATLVLPLVAIRILVSQRRRTNEYGSKANLVATRHSAKSQKLSHSHDPLIVMRGEGCYLIDDRGRRYLDSRNNVASIGHQHPDWVRDVSVQLSLTNTNARYLHPLRNELVAELCSTLPKELSVCFLVNSGSEATELALRLARTKTKLKTVLSVRMGYHGVTNAALEASPYKWEGREFPEMLHVIELGQSVLDVTTKVPIGAFIVESALSVGGVLFPPPNWLSQSIRAIKNQDGVSICDEIQVGLGRTGKWFWAFQRDENCIPDIVTIGKGIGNGFPVAIVMCTSEVAAALDEENREVFSTFGGNPVACQAALTVLRVIKRDQLQANALRVGEYMLQKLRTLTTSLIREVRGSGLFLGIEFMSGVISSKVSRRLYDVHCVLSSLDGPEDRVMVIKPPLCWQEKQVEEFLVGLIETLNYIALN